MRGGDGGFAESPARAIAADAFPFVWVDVRQLGLSDAQGVARLAAGGIGARPGSEFGPAGAGCLRFTLALPAPELAVAGRRAAQLLMGAAA